MTNQKELNKSHHKNAQSELVELLSASLKERFLITSINVPFKVIAEEFLSRPPFAFIHNLVALYVNDGFAQGLFSETELAYDQNRFTKFNKIRFLIKTLACVSIVTGERVDVFVSPAKVIAGKDVNSTHYFLRALVVASKAPHARTKEAALHVMKVGENILYKQAVRTRNTLHILQLRIREYVNRKRDTSSVTFRNENGSFNGKNYVISRITTLKSDHLRHNFDELTQRKQKGCFNCFKVGEIPTPKWLGENDQKKAAKTVLCIEMELSDGSDAKDNIVKVSSSPHLKRSVSRRYTSFEVIRSKFRRYEWYEDHSQNDEPSFSEWREKRQFQNQQQSTKLSTYIQSTGSHSKYLKQPNSISQLILEKKKTEKELCDMKYRMQLKKIEERESKLSVEGEALRRKTEKVSKLAQSLRRQYCQLRKEREIFDMEKRKANEDKRKELLKKDLIRAREANGLQHSLSFIEERTTHIPLCAQCGGTITANNALKAREDDLKEKEERVLRLAESLRNRQIQYRKHESKTEMRTSTKII